MSFKKKQEVSSKKKKKRVVYVIMMMGSSLPDVGSLFPEQDKKEEEINKGEVG